MAANQKLTPVEVKTLGEQLLGVYWQDEYYPVVVKGMRYTKDCSARLYTVKSEELLLTLRRDELTGAWAVEAAAS